MTPSLSLAEEPLKRSLASDMQVVYHVLPPEASSLAEVFSEGIFYGRVRSNFFAWDWETASSSRRDHETWGVGGSLTYKTAPWAGWSATLSGYSSFSPFLRPDRAEAADLRAGKDVLSREELRREGDYHLLVLGEAYLQWSPAAWDFRVGRQLFESPFTASNDTKMIPNAFDGASVGFTGLPQTRVRLAVFTAQKLRDHSTSHDVLTYRDASGNTWGNNDDSGVHQGLSHQTFVAAGEDPEHELLILTGENSSLSRLKLTAGLLSVPEVLWDALVEVNYELPLGSWTLIPGLRYLGQFDDGGGPLGGASLSGNVSPSTPRGYRHPDSLEGHLGAGRLVLQDKNKIYRFQVGYSQVADAADIVAPWRSFPTGGYTRALGQLNWRADARTSFLQAGLDAAKAGWLPGFRATASVAWTDNDERKGFTDVRVVHLDLWQAVSALPGLEFKARLAFVEDEGASSYDEYRLEMNYLF